MAQLFCFCQIEQISQKLRLKLYIFKHCEGDEGVGVMASTWLHYFKGRTQDSTFFLKGKKVEKEILRNII